MDNILKEPLAQYLSAKECSFKDNNLANRFRHDFPELVASLIPDKERYKVVGSAGHSRWAECPWIAIYDTLITESAQTGYYPVYLFKTDMSGVYLSLNQGVTRLKQDYKKDAKHILRLRALDFRAKMDIKSTDLTDIYLEAKGDARLYEDGNIIAKYYPADNIPNSERLRADLVDYLNLYEELAYNDSQIDENEKLNAVERKQYRLHYRIERNQSITKKVKDYKGYKCEACGFDFKSKYGEMGSQFIEAHHLKPISSLKIGNTKINIKDDFAVLCSNCHSMIHKLKDPSDVQELKRRIKTITNKR